MAHHFSYKRFFRGFEGNLLDSFFQKQGLSEEDLKSQKSYSNLVEWWKNVKVPNKEFIILEMNEIYGISSERGFSTCRKYTEIYWSEEPKKLEEFRDEMKKLEGFNSRTLKVYLNYPEIWGEIRKFVHVDLKRPGKKRNGLKNFRPNWIDTYQALGPKIAKLLSESEGRPSESKVEKANRGDQHYFFVYLKDFTDEVPEWNGDLLEKRKREPVQEIIFVFNPEKGSLILHADLVSSLKNQLMEIFAVELLGYEKLPPPEKSPMVYNLNSIKDADFSLVPNDDTIVKSIELKSVRLSSYKRGGEKIIIQASPQTSNKLRYLQEKILESSWGKGFHVTRIEAVAFCFDRIEGEKRVEFSVTHPDSCSLKSDEIDLAIQQVLEDSGIELMPSEFLEE